MRGTYRIALKHPAGRIWGREQGACRESNGVCSVADALWITPTPTGILLPGSELPQHQYQDGPQWGR